MSVLNRPPAMSATGVPHSVIYPRARRRSDITFKGIGGLQNFPSFALSRKRVLAFLIRGKLSKYVRELIPVHDIYGNDLSLG